MKPTLQQIEDYVREKNLFVDPDFFFEFYEADNWKSQGKPIKSWKQKLLTWHRKELTSNKPRRCCFGGCRKPGIYPYGHDVEGFPLFRCIDHKPIRKPVLPKDMTDNLLKTVPDSKINVNNERNRQMRLLK